ncbi:MAG: PRC-barrel domain-containing protein [Candidatus Bathyarchaeota archaeon]|nr:PRC-barrel domain-containing protein [Candidatus Bathyarchaeota archaeon]MDH5734298.1 PRC-barrel domain-containing protein [Candidatus Bathyarchaeota archaeon]
MMSRELEGKEIIDAKADKFGKVIGIGIDCSEMRVTYLRIEVDDDIVKLWGYKKPFLGHLQVLIPVGVISVGRDVMNVKKSATE